MIFVTVGTSDDFSRLLKKMDEVAGRMDEEVIMQIGHSSYIPIHAKSFRFEPNEKIYDNYIKQARIMVCHAGIGSIIKGLNYNIPVIVVPRQKKFCEIRDDHQEETVCALANEGQIIVANEIEDLESLLNKPIMHSQINTDEHDALIRRLNSYLKKNLGN